MFLATVASAALASCVSEDHAEITQESKAISFDAPVMATQTRAEVYGEIDGTDYPDEEAFAVFAKQYNGNFTSWNAGTNFWEGELTVARQGNENKWYNADKKYYWPDAPVSLAFAAYSPAVPQTGSGFKASYTETYGMGFVNFVVNTDVENQVDLMYASLVKNQTQENNAESGVNLTFKHALSSVVFAAVDANENATYTINSLSVSGRFYTTGTFKEVPSTDATSPSWELSETSPSADVTYAPAYPTETSKFEVPVNTYGFVTGTGNATAGAATAILPIPQDVPEDAIVTITYTETPKNGAAATYTKEIKLKNFTTDTEKNNTAGAVENWAVGNRYIYVFKFGEAPMLYFVPAVTDWVDQTAVYYHL